MSVQEGIIWDNGQFKRGLQDSISLVEATVKKHAALFEQHTADAGTVGAKQYLKNMRQTFDTGMTSLRDSLSRGIIDPKMFTRMKADLTNAFNTNVRGAMAEVAKGGADATNEVNKLARALKTVGNTARDGARDNSSFFGAIKDGSEGATSPLMKLKGIIAGIAGFFLVRMAEGFIGDSIKEAEDAASAWGRLSGAIENTGRNSESVRPQLEAAARSASDNTRFSDDEALDGLATLMAATNNYTGSVENMNLVLDVAVGRKTSLERASRLVAAAIDQGEEAVAKLHKQYDDVAKAEGGVIGGAMKIRKEWKEVKEALGDAILGGDQMTSSTNEMIASLKELQVWIKNNRAEIGHMAAELVDATIKVARFVLSIPTRFSPTRTHAVEELARVRSQPQTAESLKAYEAALQKEMADRQMESDRAKLASNNLGRIAAAAPSTIVTAGGRALEANPERRRIQALQDELSKKQARAEQRIAEIELVLAGLSGDIAEKGGTAATSNHTPLGPTDDQNKKWADLVTQWRALQATDLQKQIDQAKEFLSALEHKGGKPEEINTAKHQIELLEAQQAEEEKSRKRISDLLEKMKPDVQRAAPALLTIAEPNAILSASTALEAYSSKISEAQLLAHKGILSQGELRAAEDKAASEFNLQIIQIIDNIKATTPEAKKLKQELIAMLKGANAGAEDWKATIAKTSSTVAGVARGLLSAADAMGTLDESSKKVLENIIGIAEGAGRIAAGDIVGGGVQILGSLASVFSSSGDDKVAVELSDRLAELKDAVEENNRILGGNQKAGLVAAGPASSKALLDKLYGGSGTMTTGTLKDVSRDAGAMEQLRQLDKMMPNLHLMDLFKDALSGDQAAFTAFAIAAQTARITIDEAASAFGKISDDNVAGQISRFRAEVDLLDLDTPTQQLEAFIDVLKRLGGENGGGFAKELEALVKAGDTDGARKRVREIFEQMRSGQLTADDLVKLFGKGFTADDIEQILLDANKWLEDIAGGGDAGETKSTQIARTITDIQAEEVVALLDNINWLLEQILTSVRGPSEDALTAAARRPDFVTNSGRIFMQAAADSSNRADIAVARSAEGLTSVSHYDLSGWKVGTGLTDNDIDQILIKIEERLRNPRRF